MFSRIYWVTDNLRAQIAEFFRKSIDGTLGLIRRQLAAAERKGLDVKVCPFS